VVLVFAEKEVKAGPERVLFGAQIVIESWLTLDARNELLVGGAIIAARGSTDIAGIEFEHGNGTIGESGESATVQVPVRATLELSGGRTFGGERGGLAGASALAVSSVSGKTQRLRVLS